MEVSAKAKERFCKDCNIPIRIFHEPYFTDRLILYDGFYDTASKWDIFVSELAKYHHEQDYFEEYNKVKDDAISYIKGTDGYKRFNEADMNQYHAINGSLPCRDIFKHDNDGKSFISIDMVKANFSSLYYYDAGIFGRAGSWEKFMRKFTENSHIANSKYIRQVILGNCNPKRHITYEKFIMDGILRHLMNMFLPISRVVSFSNDEIILDVSDMKMEVQERLAAYVSEIMVRLHVPLKTELFVLHAVSGTGGFYKETSDGKIELKCMDSYMLPFVIRRFKGEDITESDKVFYEHGMLAKFIEVPEITFN